MSAIISLAGRGSAVRTARRPGHELRSLAMLIVMLLALAMASVPSILAEEAPTEAAPATSPASEPIAPADEPETEPEAPLGPNPYPVPDDQPPDYPLSSGHFFTQAVPGAARGYGFSVVDAAGIPLWREYQRLGGLPKLGYPVSRRFIWKESIAQAFQGGILRWRAQRGEAELAAREEVGKLPLEAVEPEPPARLGATARRQPWSGWWWPASRAVGGPYLSAPDGPLAKYDQLVAATGGDNPQTLEWELREVGLNQSAWAGHCNGWAAAALLEDEPTEPREVVGISFSVADLKGLLSAYHFADAAAWLHGGEVALTPLDLHRRLLEWLGDERKGFIVTFAPTGSDEVWSYPLYRFELTMSPDPLNPEVTHVQAALWLADNNVPADFVGLRPWRDGPQVVEYRLLGPREAPTSGEWEGASAQGGFKRPAYIWYPEPEIRNLDRQLASPNLDYRVIRRILRRE